MKNFLPDFPINYFTYIVYASIVRFSKIIIRIKENLTRFEFCIYSCQCRFTVNHSLTYFFIPS